MRHEERMGEMKSIDNVLDGKPQGKRHCEIWRRMENNNKNGS